MRTVFGIRWMMMYMSMGMCMPCAVRPRRSFL